MSFNDIDDTLVAYFKQMLEEECDQQSPEAESQVEEEAIAKTEVRVQSDNEQSAGSETEGTEVAVDEDQEEVAIDVESSSEAEELDSADTSSPDEIASVSESAAQETVDEDADETVELDESVAAESSEGEPVVSEDVVAENNAAESAAETSDVEDVVSEDAAESFENAEAQEVEEVAATSDAANESSEFTESTEVVSESSSDDIDYASDDYVPETPVSDSAPALQPQLQTAEAKTEPLPFAEHKSLESLLESVPKTQLDTEVAVETATETAVETAVETETVTETAVEEQTQVEQVTASESVVADESAVQAQQEESNDEAPYNWTNIEMPEEFQVLFFLVKGIRFAVPLVNLGGIFQCDKVTPLFGKPDWFQGIADIRGRKMNVVDTLKWVKSDAPSSDKYEYMISLDKTLWSIGCDVLEGNRILNRENITWRQTAGNRPWLAGIVKKEMCALLHVKALIKMFENGVNLKDLDAQMSA